MLFLDTSSLLKRYVDEAGSEAVLELMAADTDWVASALAATEAEIALCHVGVDGRVLRRLRVALRRDWARFLVVPVDARCLADATELGCAHRLRTLDAIHLAAAERLAERPTFVTFDTRQARVARAAGYPVAGAPDVPAGP